MKKAIVILLALAVLGGVVFAQDAAAPAVAFSGFIETGVAYSKTGSDDATMGLYSHDWDGNVIRFTAKLAGEGYGFNYTLENDAFATSEKTYAKYLFVWADLFGGKAKATAGLLNATTWMTYWNVYGRTRTSALQLEVKPMDGVDVGIILPVSSTAALANDIVLKSMLLAGSYKTDAIDVVAGYKMAPEDTLEEFAYFGATYKAIETLTINVEGKLSALSDYSNFGKATFIEGVEYTKDAIYAGLYLGQHIGSMDQYPIGLGINPFGEYTMDKMTFGLDVNVYITTKTDSMDAYNGYDVNPYVSFAVGGDCRIELGGHYAGGDLPGYEDFDDGMDTPLDTTDDFTLNADATTKVYIDFVWSF